jgi:hypothetical protein
MKYAILLVLLIGCVGPQEDAPELSALALEVKFKEAERKRAEEKRAEEWARKSKERLRANAAIREKAQLEIKGHQGYKSQREREKSQREREKRLERARIRRREQYVASHPNLPKRHKLAIVAGEILLGMTSEQVRLSWGLDDFDAEQPRINRTVTRFGSRAQWVFGDFDDRLYLYFDDDILTAWQDSLNGTKGKRGGRAMKHPL